MMELDGKQAEDGVCERKREQHDDCSDRQDRRAATTAQHDRLGGARAARRSERRFDRRRRRRHRDRGIVELDEMLSAGQRRQRFVDSILVERFDNWLLTEQLLRLLGSRPGPLLLALDWTAWHDRFSVLTASVCTGTRSVPVAASACTARNLSRSQNLFGETFLRLAVDSLRAAGAFAIWL